LAVIEGRAGGILFHPTSLPGPHGIGDLGPAAHEWVAWLARAGCRLWQMLPLGPTGYGDSPYQSFSAFAGNPLLISPDVLVQEGLLRRDEVEGAPDFPAERVDFGAVIAWKDRLLTHLTDAFDARARREQRDQYEQFREANRSWLDDFAVFMALKRAHGGAPWTEWPEGLRARDPEALIASRQCLESEVKAQSIRQFCFFRQWSALAEAAHTAGIDLVGDVPIFVAHDSADVWAHPGLFALDGFGQPEFVAGVPPDYFSPTGQRWGNPLYRWESMRADGYAWWVRRLQAVLSAVDIVRLDHFRGFEACWEIPASAPTAETGRWAPGPGAEFLSAVRRGLGGMPIIAEDLGVITPAVKKLRTDFGLPGMKVLQFAFDGTPKDEFLPHNYPERCVVYTGTHDNDTVVGWYDSAAEDLRDLCRRYLGRDGSEIAWDMIRAAWSSVAQWAIAPLQDVLSLGAQARMNYPSREHGNWGWRVRGEQLTDALADRLAEWNRIYGRLAPGPAPEADA
jgi:4-alpha-glucanotransferase